MLFVFLHDTLMKVVEAIETCRCIIINDKTYCIDVFVCLLRGIQKVADLVPYGERNVPENLHREFLATGRT
jgi:hypothetical protein